MKLDWQDIDRNDLPRSVKRAIYISDGEIGYIASVPTASFAAGIREFVRTYTFNPDYHPACCPTDGDDLWEAELLIRINGDWIIAEAQSFDPAEYYNPAPRSKQ